jgi:hypothetical protein
MFAFFMLSLLQHAEIVQDVGRFQSFKALASRPRLPKPRYTGSIFSSQPRSN